MQENPERFNCKNCQLNHHCDTTLQWPESNGPAGYDIIEVQRAGFEFKSKTCLLPQITERTNYFFRLHKHYQNGVMPFSGGLLDQPAVFIEAMDIIDR